MSFMHFLCFPQGATCSAQSLSGLGCTGADGGWVSCSVQLSAFAGASVSCVHCFSCKDPAPCVVPLRMLLLSLVHVMHGSHITLFNAAGQLRWVWRSHSRARDQAVLQQPGFDRTRDMHRQRQAVSVKTAIEHREPKHRNQSTTVRAAYCLK